MAQKLPTYTLRNVSDGKLTIRTLYCDGRDLVTWTPQESRCHESLCVSLQRAQGSYQVSGRAIPKVADYPINDRTCTCSGVKHCMYDLVTEFC